MTALERQPVGTMPPKKCSPVAAPKHPPAERDPKAYVWAIAAVAGACGVALLARPLLPVESLSLLFLVSVLLIATRFGPWPSVFASVVSFLVYNFFLTEPYYTFLIADTRVRLALFLFLFIAIVMGNMAARLRARVEAQRAVVMERARLAADMEESRLLAEKERLRSALLSSVSHDLRTPLVSIIGAATSLLEASDAITADGRRQLLETIREEGERLNRYVQNLLDMTRISHGALPLNRQWIEPREMVGGALRQLRRELKDKRVVVSMPEGLPALQGDALLLEQALVNVLDNAAKYSPSGTEITVVASVEGKALHLSVTDQGRGIPNADRERVFDMFHRVEAGDAHRTGTGLGLAIARGIVAVHGGTIRALASEAERTGTRIEIELPLPDSEPRAIGEEPERPEVLS